MAGAFDGDTLQWLTAERTKVPRARTSGSDSIRTIPAIAAANSQKHQTCGSRHCRSISRSLLIVRHHPQVGANSPHVRFHETPAAAAATAGASGWRREAGGRDAPDPPSFTQVPQLGSGKSIHRTVPQISASDRRLMCRRAGGTRGCADLVNRDNMRHDTPGLKLI
jgi:hypothetical protein